MQAFALGSLQMVHVEGAVVEIGGAISNVQITTRGGCTNYCLRRKVQRGKTV